MDEAPPGPGGGEVGHSMTESPAERCRRYRRRILDISRQVGAAHVAPAFSCLEIVDALYHGIMGDDDVFIMSKGHGYLAQLVVLEDLGVVPTADLDVYCRAGGRLGAHPDYAPEIGIHASTGSLGHGLGIAAGRALGKRLRGHSGRVYVLLSDGECQEGSTWEAAMVAANLDLGNLVALIDSNGWGGMDRIPEDFPVMAGLDRKFEAFGWYAYTVADGHSGSEVRSMADHVRVMAWDRPAVLVCRTVKGRGVSYMEAGMPLWHYRSPSDEEYAQAMEELR